MNTSLSARSIEKISGKLRTDMAAFAEVYPGEAGPRQPVHVVYGGAHLFHADTASKLGRLALRSLETFAPDVERFASAFRLDASLADPIYSRVREKLTREAVEDFRIDFEDGYGVRPDVEEDGHAIAAAEQTAAAMTAGKLPPFFGIRVKAFTDEAFSRSVRTLDLYLTALTKMTLGELPAHFVVTFPKIVTPSQVVLIAGLFDELEAQLGIATGSLKMEVMIETTQSIIAADGSAAMPKIIAAGRGRCRGAHFGAYDYTAACGITSAYQDMLHPACDFARNMMQVSLRGTGVWLADGATNIMPVGPHRGDELSEEQQIENASVVHRAWRLHYDHCRHSLANGFYQGWDLHPAQLPSRYAAVYAFFLEGLEAAAGRLNNFLERAAQATLVGDVFDDAATGQGLLNYFLKAVNCGALTEQEVMERTSLTLDELRSGSFAKILDTKQLQANDAELHE